MPHRESHPPGPSRATAAAAGRSESANRPRSDCTRVIVIEDERRLREMLLTSVREMGFDPAGASSAESATRVLDQSAFAIAVVDLNLPGMGGLDFCEVIRRRWPAMQIIILTGFGDLESAKRAIRMDAADFLTKPCGMNELESALVRARTRWLERWLSPSPTGAAMNGPPVSESGQPSAAVAPQSAAAESAPRPPSKLSLEQVERDLIFEALARHDGNREAAAADLGISVRKLYYRLQQYQMRGML